MALTSYLLLFIALLCSTAFAGILYPKASDSRTIYSLDGLWDFSLNQNSSGLAPHTIHLMPVPSSYNEIAVENELLWDYVGTVWYQRRFFTPKSWSDSRVWIRFGSVCHHAEAFINGKSAVKHDIGHLPFQAEITSLVSFGKFNNITVAVDNILNQTTIPQGTVQKLRNGRLKQTNTMDFYNFAGIDRSVFLYTTPKTYIDDITVHTNVTGTTGTVNYEVLVVGTEHLTPRVSLLARDGTVAATANTLNGTLTVPNAHLWWPYLMDPNPGYQYDLQIELLDATNQVYDKYIQKIGIRSLSWGPKGVNINNKPIYIRGFGRHEDSDIRGRGLDLSLVIRDHNLMRWIGANAYRTSHYPYADEILDVADEFGIMLIDESPAANTENFSPTLLANHKRALSELYLRDKNRPGVVIWSVANEPRTQYNESGPYYKEVVAHMRSLDRTRPITVVNNQLPLIEHSGEYLDIACTNIYYGWYTSTGELDNIIDHIIETVKQWNTKHNIPVIMTEYGGDTQEGYHQLPSFVWSEDYQLALHSKYFEAYDRMREAGYFIGEMIWNFADFRTTQTPRRVGGNKKGVFTRDRQPKAVAHLVRKRYWALAQKLNNATLPKDLYDYTIKNGGPHS